MFKIKAWLMAPIWLYQCCCPLTLTVATSHQVGAHLSARSPGDMISSPNIKSEQKVLPCAGVWAPLQARVTGEPSTAQEPLAVHSVVVSVIRQLGESAGDTGGKKI